MERSHLSRRLRIAASVFFTLVAVALCVLWVRSYWYVEQVLCTVDQRYVLMSSVPGALGFSILAEESVDPWVVYRMPTKEWRASKESQSREQSWGGFHVDFTHGPIVVAPYWCWLLLPAMFAATPWLIRSNHFSLRTLLITTTVVAAGLGLAVWTVR